MGGVAAETMIGQIVAHYRITAKLGAGGEAAVDAPVRPRVGAAAVDVIAAIAAVGVPAGACE